MVRGLEMEAFLDLDSIRAGDAWPDVLRQEIEDAYLGWVGWSRYAAQSAWVRREDTEALRKGPGALRIDLLDDTPLPPELEHIQAERSALGQPAAERLLQAPLRLLPEVVDKGRGRRIDYDRKAVHFTILLPRLLRDLDEVHLLDRIEQREISNFEKTLRSVLPDDLENVVVSILPLDQFTR